MDLSKAFKRDYLTASDFEDRPKTMIIKKIVEGTVGDDVKPIVYFEDEEMGFVMNKTNTNIVQKLYGKNSDDAIGKPLTLYHTMTEFKGDMVPAIRCRAPKSEPRKDFQPKARVPEYDDDGYPIK